MSMTHDVSRSASSWSGATVQGVVVDEVVAVANVCKPLAPIKPTVWFGEQRLCLREPWWTRRCHVGHEIGDGFSVASDHEALASSNTLQYLGVVVA